MKGKKTSLVAIAVFMVLIMFSACSKSEGKAAATSSDTGKTVAEDVFKDIPTKITADKPIKATPAMYSNIDLSKEDTVYIYLIGDTPNDWDKVVELANEYLKPFNTKVQFTIMAWSDYQDLYPLSLISGTDIDAIFTAPWCYLWTEASKGSFLNFSEDFIKKYMPLTDRLQIKGSWDGVKLNGNIVAIPQNATNPNGKIVAIRQDLAEKYGIKELKSWEDYKNFCLTIAEKETPQSGILAMAASGSNGELWETYRQAFDTMPAIQNGNIIYYYKYDGKVPAYKDMSFAYETDYFKSFIADMKEMADAGVWSRSALTNQISDDDAFAALAGASIAWNTSVFTFMDTAEKAEGVKCAAYDITQKSFSIGEAMNNNDMAITASTPRPERTAMILDLFKMDTYLNRLIRLGIEGVHYSIDNQGNYTALDKATDYPADNVSFGWALKNGELVQAGKDPRRKAIEDEEAAKMAVCPTEGFVFDDSKVQFEAQAVNAVFDEYIPSLQLGLFEDPEAKRAEMMKLANEAGLPVFEAEFKKQYEAWYAAMTK
ncbi:MAG: ABC transporter substrate-binding protein [Treponemataceae bacterium]|nr:ABC transporter substrate-binding protein [Treponemataceae bacterium]